MTLRRFIAAVAVGGGLVAGFVLARGLASPQVEQVPIIQLQRDPPSDPPILATTAPAPEKTPAPAPVTAAPPPPVTSPPPHSPVTSQPARPPVGGAPPIDDGDDRDDGDVGDDGD